MQRLQFAALSALILGYAGLCHYSTESPNARGLGAGLSIGPVLLIGIVVAWRWTRPLIAMLIGLCLCATVYFNWDSLERHFEWADLIQQCGLYALVTLSFAVSLLKGRVPLCTQLARKLYGDLSPAELSYTRHATIAWLIFYGVLTFAILVLFLLAPLNVWSLFVNFGTFGLMILAGVADHAIHQRVLPGQHTGGLLAAIRRAIVG